MSAITDSLKKLVNALRGSSESSSVSGNNIADGIDEVTKAILEKPSSESAFEVIPISNELDTFIQDWIFSHGNEEDLVINDSFTVQDNDQTYGSLFTELKAIFDQTIENLDQGKLLILRSIDGSAINNYFQTSLTTFEYFHTEEETSQLHAGSGWYVVKISLSIQYLKGMYHDKMVMIMNGIPYREAHEYVPDNR